VGQNRSLFASADIRYVLDWLACAKQHGLTTSYLGGRNKRDNGSHGAWFHSLRRSGQRRIRQRQDHLGSSLSTHKWEYITSPDVAILGARDNCGDPTASAGRRPPAQAPSRPGSPGNHCEAANWARWTPACKPAARAVRTSHGPRRHP
jgi:hypothetical protein